MKAGFSLLELVISLAIASVVSIALTQFLSQTGKYQAAVENQASIYTRASIVLHQMEKDIMGAYVPIQNSALLRTNMELLRTKKEEKPKEPQKQQPGQQQAAQSKQAPEQKKKEEKKEPPVQRVFFVEQPNKELKLFSCITSNPLQVYWSKQVGKAKPKIARVVYTLEQDSDNKQAFILKRQEDSELDIKKYLGKDTQIRAYEVCDRVKSCRLRFTLIKEAEQEQPAQKGEQKKQPVQKERTVTEHTVWDWPKKEEQAQTKDEAQKKEPPLPTLVTVELDIWNTKYDRATTFTYTIPIITDVSESPEQEEKKQDAKPARGGTQQQGAQQRGRQTPGPLARNTRNTTSQKRYVYTMGGTA